MKTKNHQPQPLKVTKGQFSDIIYDSYSEMDKSSSSNWHYACTYQLLPNSFIGRHRILQLDTILLSFASRIGGMMYNGSSPKDCISIAIIEEVADKFCFEDIKLQTGDILFFDDRDGYSIINNDYISFCVITISTTKLQEIIPNIDSLLYHTIKDKEKILSLILYQVWDKFTNSNNKSTDYQEAEAFILNTLLTIVETQTPIKPKLTKGENIALSIRNQVYTHMDCKVDITAISKRHNISQRSLQLSFKSLFGFTPKLFLRRLKLNHVHNELKKSHNKDITVMKIAYKWGFLHMGRFSTYYKELFGENPSITLQKAKESNKLMQDSCADRKEEMI